MGDRCLREGACGDGMGVSEVKDVVGSRDRVVTGVGSLVAVEW